MQSQLTCALWRLYSDWVQILAWCHMTSSKQAVTHESA